MEKLSKLIAIFLIVFGTYFLGTQEEWLQTLEFQDDLFYLLEEHLLIAFTSISLSIVIGIPFGIFLSASFMKKLANPIIQILNLGGTIPTLAVIAISMVILGIGFLPSVFALFLITLLPIVRNTYTGICSVPSFYKEAAMGIGMTKLNILLKVELPNSLNIIFAGIRTAASFNIGTVPLAFLVGGGGLGEFIFIGLRLNDYPMLLLGAVSTAFLAVLLDMLLAILNSMLLSTGLKIRQ